MDRYDRLGVERQLKKMGYWYPPDAIDAVAAGRDTYHPLDPAITYPVTPVIQKRIKQALDALKGPRFWLGA